MDTLRTDSQDGDPRNGDARKAGSLAAGRLIVGHRRALAIETAAAAGVLAGLVEAVGYVETAPPDLQIGYGLALFLFTIAMMLLFHHATELLELECPRCKEIFHGDGVERFSSPFRRRCAHCEMPPSPRRGA